MIEVGTLNDKSIIEMCQDKRLISEGFQEKNVKQACYEIRSSYEYYDLSDDAKYYNLKESDFGYILLKLRQMVVILSLEKFNIPKDVIGRIMTKGKLFSIGIIPVNTYADPGFKGRLGIVLQNLSTKYIKIKPKEEIAKIEFSKLQEEVEEPYAGQHGYNTHIWPVDKKYWLNHDDINNDKRIKTVSSEIGLSYGKQMSKMLELIENYERKIFFLSISYLIFATVFISILNIIGVKMGALRSTILGIVPSFIGGLLMEKATNFRKG